MSTDEDATFMRRCLQLARRARDAGETAVGSLVVCHGEVRGEGIESTRRSGDPAGHAEMQAIRQACQVLASRNLNGCTLYTTVEPCFLCGYAIRSTGIGRVVFGTDAGEVGAVNSRYPFLTDASFTGWGPVPEVVGGVLHAEAEALLQGAADG